MNISFRRFAVAPALLILAVACVAPAAEQADGDYWPLKEGNKWNFLVKMKDQSVPITMQVAKVENVDGQPLARLETVVNGNVTATEDLVSNDQGVFRHRINGADVAPPVPLIRYPVKKGDNWSLETSSAGEKFQVDSSVDLQDVTVPAGAFRTAVVVTETTIPAGKILNRQWFAPGVGLVKQEYQLPDGSTFVVELDKFEPAK